MASLPMDGLFDRRGFMDWARHGLSAAAITTLLMQEKVAHAATIPGESADPPPHHTAKAKRIIHICMCGGLSQIDSFDYKPTLDQAHGKTLGGKEKPETFFDQVGRLRRSDWPFRQHGQSGLWISDLFPHLGTVADDLTVIRSMSADSANHTPATFQELSGFRLNGFPTMGAWLSYGLGAEADNLPAYVVLPDPRGFPAGGTINWTNGFLPARHQGVPFRITGNALDDLQPARPIAATTDQASRLLLKELDQQHYAERQSDVLAARLKGYELAAKMQLAVPQVMEIAQEPQKVQQDYGIDQPETNDFGRQCLLARRLLQKGVRFVQIFSGGSFGSPRINWDGHENMIQNHAQEAKRIDQPIAALIRDLKRQGMLEDTLVLGTTEFGRTPFTQSGPDQLGTGRDHNMYGFSVWLAGSGLKHGMAFGRTDDLCHKAVENIVTWPDFHATILHLLGIDHERLTVYHNGIQRRLTNVHGEIVKGILQ